ncbi:secretory carrier-associated membrane protein 4 isoform X2 [Scleropages formosus]|uniref:secretory carrier-associated membrane protein 4 isoform X2 n=1 Tax=Scleropages formosus TaxID=113540 RepID=UPI000878DA20|nr:secretory carrier-associated membrane protein 4 isoform X2 [Scleropages formosus]
MLLWPPALSSKLWNLLCGAAECCCAHPHPHPPHHHHLSILLGSSSAPDESTGRAKVQHRALRADQKDPVTPLQRWLGTKAGETEVHTMPERLNNFPPLPAILPVKPCFYQNVEEEIPAQHQQLVRRVYNLWILYSVTLCVNVVSCVAWWAGGGSGVNFGLALLWLLLFSPCSYICWFRPLYKAFRADSSFNFMVFFYVFFLQCVLVVIQAVGISGWGASGWVATILFFSDNVGSAVVMLLSALLFTAVAVLMGLVFIKVHRLYRGGGGSLQRAQEEWNSGAWKSTPAREADFNTISSGPSLPQYPTAVPSYPDNGPW